MAGFWSGFGQGFSRSFESALDRRERRREFETTLAERRRERLLPQLLKRAEERDKNKKAAALIYRKGVQLFGKDVANTLENMGELGTVVSQYESTEGGKDWANLVSVRTEKFLKGMLESDDQAQRQTALRLLERGSYLGNASEGEKSDYLNELSATGVLSEEELMDLDLEVDTGTSYTGSLPDFGQYDQLTPSQLEDTSKSIAAGVIPGARVVRTAEGVDIIAPDNVSNSFVEGLRVEIMNDLAANQLEYGPAKAQSIVLQDYANNFDQKSQYIVETYNVPSPPVFSVPGQEEEVDTAGAGVNPMELQESMGDIVEVEPTVPTVPIWQEGVFGNE